MDSLSKIVSFAFPNQVTLSVESSFLSNPAEKIYATFVFRSGFVLPLIIIGFTYSNIFGSTRRHARRVSQVSFSSTSSTNSTTACRQTAVAVLILLMVLLLCWLPYFLHAVLLSVDCRVIAWARPLTGGVCK